MLISFARELDCIAPSATTALPLTSVRPGALDHTLAALPAEIAAFVRASGFKA